MTEEERTVDDVSERASHAHANPRFIKLEEPVSSMKPARLHAPTLSWGLYDFTAMTGESLPANNGHFVSLPGHRYLVVLRAEDGSGVSKITLDGSGTFDAWTIPTSSGVTYEAPYHLQGSIPHQEFNSHDHAPSLQDLVVIMDPDIGAWEYESLSCGHHAFGGIGSQEYFAVSGVMTFSGTALNVFGRESKATLTTTP